MRVPWVWRMGRCPSTAGRASQSWAWWRGIAIGLTVLLSLVPAWIAAEDAISDPPAENGQQADVPPLATEPPPPPTSTPSPPPSPTPPPPTSTPPPPTEAPTATPSPTEAPGPVDPTVTPTAEVPTGGPATPPGEPHASPTPTPTSSPTPTPTPSPTPNPAIPFEPVVTCDPVADGAPPTAGTGVWSMLACTASWATQGVSTVEVSAWTAETGWRVIVVDANAPDQPDVLDASDGHLTLVDRTPGDDGFLTGHFQLGTQLDCTAPLTVTIHLDFTATSAEPGRDGDEPVEPTVETYRTDLDLEGSGPTPPVVTLNGITFTSVEASGGTRMADGTIRIAYTGASTCGWRVDVTISDFTGEEGQTVSASGLTTATVNGVPGATVSGDQGRYTIRAPGGAAAGEVVLYVSLDVPDALMPGAYTATVVIAGGPDP